MLPTTKAKKMETRPNDQRVQVREDGRLVRARMDSVGERKQRKLQSKCALRGVTDKK